MSDLISRESLKHRINLNYNNHQYIDTQSIKDIINTEPSVEDKTVEELKKIKAEIDLQQEDTETEYFMGFNLGLNICKGIIQNHIAGLKEESKEYEAEVITRGNCMICGKELTEGLFICKECENKANSGK